MSGLCLNRGCGDSKRRSLMMLDSAADADEAAGEAKALVMQHKTFALWVPIQGIGTRVFSHVCSLIYFYLDLLLEF